MNIKPLGGRVLVLPISETVTAGGIVLSNNAVQRPSEGKVVAVGPGRRLASGERVPLEIKEGDTVIYTKYHSGAEVKDGAQTYVLLDDSVVLAVKGKDTNL